MCGGTLVKRTLNQRPGAEGTRAGQEADRVSEKPCPFLSAASRRSGNSLFLSEPGDQEEAAAMAASTNEFNPRKARSTRL